MSGAAFRERLRTVPQRVKFLAALNTALLLVCAVSALLLRGIGPTFQTLTAAERFRGDSDLRFAQIACYLPDGKKLDEEKIAGIREQLAAKFVEQSLTVPENGSLFLDAYSMRTRLTAATEHGSAETAAFAVGGEFFYFHPLRLRSGTYIAERDLMDDLVVLDETLAWRLFGGIELAGMPLTINGKPFVVAGVVAMEEDFAAKHALTEEGTLFLSCSALERIGVEAAIDCYEITLPDPISGYAKSTVEELVDVGEGTVVENSGRFSLRRLAEVAGSLGQRSMRTGAVVYPYWENALRYAEDWAALLLVVVVLTALCPAVTVAVLLIRGMKMLAGFFLREVPQRIDAAVERSREKRYACLKAKDREGE